MASLYETIGQLHDTRVKGRSKHPLSDIVILAILAVTSGAEGYEAIEEFGKFHYETWYISSLAKDADFIRHIPCTGCWT